MFLKTVPSLIIATIGGYLWLVNGDPLAVSYDNTFLARLGHLAFFAGIAGLLCTIILVVLGEVKKKVSGIVEILFDTLYLEDPDMPLVKKLLATETAASEAVRYAAKAFNHATGNAPSKELLAALEDEIIPELNAIVAWNNPRGINNAFWVKARKEAADLLKVLSEISQDHKDRDLATLLEQARQLYSRCNLEDMVHGGD